jgi:hypothetical protein
MELARFESVARCGVVADDLPRAQLDVHFSDPTPHTLLPAKVDTPSLGKKCFESIQAPLRHVHPSARQEYVGRKGLMERLMLEGDEQSQWKDPRRFQAYGTLQIEFSAPSPGLP